MVRENRSNTLSPKTNIGVHRRHDTSGPAGACGLYRHRKATQIVHPMTTGVGLSQASSGQATNAIMFRDLVNLTPSFHRPNGIIIHRPTLNSSIVPKLAGKQASPRTPPR